MRVSCVFSSYGCKTKPKNNIPRKQQQTTKLFKQSFYNYVKPLKQIETLTSYSTIFLKL